MQLSQDIPSKQHVSRRDSCGSFSLPSSSYLFASTSSGPDAFSDSESSTSTSFSSSTSPSSSIASSPALNPTTAFSPIPDDFRLSDSKPTPTQITAYAASVIRAEAYALLALAARMTPANEPALDDDFANQAGQQQFASDESRTNSAFLQTVHALAALPAHGKIIVSGVGKSGIAGRKIVGTLNSLGIQAVFLHPLEALHGDLGVVCPCNPTHACDAAILLSHSGATAELMRLLPILRPRVRTMIAVTRDPDSVLARGCAHWLDAGTGAHTGGTKDGEKVTDEADSALPAPTSSVVTALAICDALALSLSKIRLGWTKDGKARRADFLRCHPGGQLSIELGREGRGVAEPALAAATATVLVATVNPILNRTEHVGSFLRPKEIHTARDANVKGTLSDAELRKVEDAAIKDVVQEQEAAGLKGVSDGEFRREYFHLDFLKHVGGVTVTKNKLVGEKAEAAPPQLTVTSKLQHIAPIQVEDYLYVKSCLTSPDSVVKVAIPSPTMVHFRGGRAAIDISTYKDMDAFFEDLAEVYRTEIAALAKAGCTFIQLDDTNLAYLCSEEMRAGAVERGEDVQALPRQYVSLINAALRDKPANMTAAIHLCRGNFRSRHFSAGGYEPVAEVLLKELDVDMYLLEYDDSRSGGFEPLRHLPKGHKVVTLGLVSTKTGVLENKADVIARIREAAKFAPLEQLSVGPQCGFASTVHGNELSKEQQWAKIKLCQEIVEEVWGKQ